MKKILFITLSILLSSSSLQALPGDLDTTFDLDGLLTTHFGAEGNESMAHAVILQPDGKIVVAGEAIGGSSKDFALSRYHPDGSLDLTFDGDGKVTTDFASRDDYAFGIALQPDGKIVVVGYAFNGRDNDFAVARYLPNGTLDNTFDSDGKVMTRMGFSQDYASGVVVQSDGKIVVVGSSQSERDGLNFAIARYHPSGALDETFGFGAGRITVDFNHGGDTGMAVTLQTVGGVTYISAAGAAFTATNLDFGAVRYKLNGQPDTSFGTGGKVTTKIGSANDEAYSLVAQPDGKLILGGFSVNGANGEDFALVRYNPNGTLDGTFDGDGIVLTTIGPRNDDLYKMALVDNKIVVAGWSDREADPVRRNADFALARYNGNGSLDTTFGGGDGVVFTPVGPASDVLSALAIQPDGKAVAAGYSDSGASNDFAVARYILSEPPPAEPAPPAGPRCGDFDRDPGEECDDGNNISGDGCDASCHIEVPAPAPVPEPAPDPISGAEPLPPPPVVEGSPEVEMGEEGPIQESPPEATPRDVTLPTSGPTAETPSPKEEGEVHLLPADGGGCSCTVCYTGK